ncbi:hypothetical protein [Winogradskyella sp. PC D3.3]
MKHQTKYSILDLLPILEGSDSANAISNAVALAQFADQEILHVFGLQNTIIWEE